MRSFRFLLALIHTNLFVFSMAYAERISESGLDGVPEKTVKLRVDDTLDSIFGLFERWETRLKTHGLEVEFLIGAGDLRRALLGMNSNGGGDIEVYVHIKNKNLYPNTFRKSLALFESFGLDITKEMQDFLGEKDKVVDIFVRDRNAIENNRPYETEIAVFEGMGDNNINALTYSPSRNLILGSLENVRALANGRIVYIETFKSRKLDNPEKLSLTKEAAQAGTKSIKSDKKAPEIEYFTDYSYTILRQDFRSTRLAVDLILQKDFLNGSLSLDQESFEVPLAGTELFFQKVPDEVIPRFALHTNDDSYIQAFLKMFRKRSNEDLAAIRTILHEKFPRKVALWKLMGLDVDLLTAPRTGKENRAKLELQAVLKNARYNSIRELVDVKTYDIANPFTSEAAFQRMGQTTDAKVSKAIPEDILRLYSPELYLRSKNFDLLPLEEKRQTVESYKSALKFLGEDAYKRLVKEVTLRNGYLDRFHFINPTGLSQNDGISLMDFLHIQWQAARINGSTSSVRPFYEDAKGHNVEVELELLQAIKKAKRNKKTPVIVVDLDNTLFESSSRVLGIFKRYDEVMKTNYFSELSLADLPTGDFKDFLYSYLMKQISDFEQLTNAVARICTFLRMSEWEYDFVSNMQAHADMVALLKAAVKKGAKIVFLTSRRPNQARATEKSLESLGLNFPVTYYPIDETVSVAEWKTNTVIDWIEVLEDVQLIGFLDNESGTINKVNAALDDLVDEGKLAESKLPIVARVHIRHHARQSHAFLVRDEAELYPIHTACSNLWSQDEE